MVLLGLVAWLGATYVPFLVVWPRTEWLPVALTLVMHKMHKVRMKGVFMELTVVKERLEAYARDNAVSLLQLKEKLHETTSVVRQKRWLALRLKLVARAKLLLSALAFSRSRL